MGKVTDFEVFKGEHKEHCPYCGGDEHVVPLACPRIAGITVYEDSTQVDISFWPLEETPAA